MKDLRLAMRISIIYVVFGCVWILASDWISFFNASMSSAYWLETVKGVIFVFVTAFLLFVLVRRGTRLLAESEERFRLLVENAPDAVVFETQGHIVYANAKMTRLIGAKRNNEILGREIFGLIHAASLDALRQRLVQVEQLKRPVEAHEITLQRADGGTVICEVSAVPIKYGCDEGALIFIRDITERSKLRERQLYIQKMETIRKMAGGLAHDLNNLLQVINGYTELACERISEKDEGRSYLDQVRTSGQRASELVSQLLAFGNRKDPDGKWIDLHAMSFSATSVLLAPESLERAPQGETLETQAGAGEGSPSLSEMGEGGGKTILIAEDEELVRNLSARILRREGYKVIEAENGDEAVRLFQEHTRDVDAVILDVVMPHMDGFEAYDHIHALDARVPILFASGYSGVDTPSHVKLEPGVNLLQKPFDVKMLLSSVRRAVAQQS
jgi:PAS domain S-box-containing protein